MRRIFLGKPIHWLLWGVVIVVLYLMGARSLHATSFNAFVLVLLALAAGCVAFVFVTHRKGDRVTRDSFDEDENQPR